MGLTSKGHWLLAGGLLARLLLIALALPLIQQVWFLPFLAAVPAHPLDPWGSFLAAGGAAAAFPYGLPYLLVFGPLTWIGGSIGGLFGAHVGLGLTVLLLELLLLRLIAGIAGAAAGPAILIYWLSPVAIYVGYWHGQLDILPVLLLVAALAAMARGRHGAGGAWLGSAVAAKFSMGLALPFIGLFYLGRARQRALASRAFAMALLALLVLFVPLLVLPGFRDMVLLTPEAAKTFSLALAFGPGLN
ncbi:MAG: glycosyltransferase 87 family protein, partial [Polymorphobacter sp.]